MGAWVHGCMGAWVGRTLCMTFRQRVEVHSNPSIPPPPHHHCNVLSPPPPRPTLTAPKPPPPRPPGPPWPPPPTLTTTTTTTTTTAASGPIAIAKESEYVGEPKAPSNAQRGASGSGGDVGGPPGAVVAHVGDYLSLEALESDHSGVGPLFPCRSIPTSKLEEFKLMAITGPRIIMATLRQVFKYKNE